MNKKVLLTIVILAAIALISSVAVAMAPLGTPTADLKEGQFGVGVEYAYTNAQIRIEGEGERLKTNMFLANLGYGVMDDWKGFLRLGTGDARADHFGGDYRFALGWGTKYTFWKEESIDWGALFQMDWLDSKADVSGADARIKPYDYLIAVGPTYKLNEEVSIYGGPFLQWIRGHAEVGDIDGSIKEKNLLGAYGGAQAIVCENTSVFGELQIYGTGWAIATGITWKF